MAPNIGWKEPVECQICSHTLERFDSLRKHIRIRHKDFLAIVCKRMKVQNNEKALDLINLQHKKKLSVDEDLLKEYKDQCEKGPFLESKSKTRTILNYFQRQG